MTSFNNTHTETISGAPSVLFFNSYYRYKDELEYVENKRNTVTTRIILA
jgi:hypothetical protein